ncbi:molybdenum ABC transporter permease [Candidatus Bathyarchaeota archaeon]|nr:MAG: molybdenum ABC transporter permease [Candidatus Bathyarchaeota archaeon]
MFFASFLFIGLFLVAFACITLGGLLFDQLTDIPTFINVIEEPEVINAIWISISASTASTAAAFIFGVPLAYILARKEFFGKNFIDGILDLPMMIPHIVAGIALFSIFNPSGIIGAPLKRLGVTFQDHFLGIVVAMLFMSFPYLVNSAREGFKAVDPKFERVSRSLGASQWTTFLKVTFPLAFPSILNGILQCWARGISEFSAVLILAYFPRSAPILIWEKFSSFGLAVSRPISVLLILICLSIFALLRLIGRGGR